MNIPLNRQQLQQFRVANVEGADPSARPFAANVPAVQESTDAPAFVSVFDDPALFDHKFKMAEMLASSLFVPGGSSAKPNESFRGNPANCLIALDLAERLGLAPTALFPHLYVINGRPALSSQFVIALVNRSGLFSRISWDETVDGEVSFESNGRRKTLPNYTAVAKFTELKTGLEYKSTPVSVELARRNGWLVKNESKWQTIPAEMCRWRSASWLAKNYAPELIFGLETSEEVSDYDAKPPIDVRPVEVAPRRETVVEPEHSRLDALYEGIRSAANEEELALVADEIGRADGLDPTEKQGLRDAYREKRAALSKARAFTPPPEPVETPEAPKRKKRTKTETETETQPEPVADPQPTEPSNEEPTDERKVQNFNELRDGIDSAQDLDGLKRCVEFVDDAKARGLVDADQAQELYAYIDQRSERFDS